MKNLWIVLPLLCAGCYQFGPYKNGSSCEEPTQQVAAVENRTGGAVNLDMNYWAINADGTQTKKTVTVILANNQVYKDVLGPVFKVAKAGSYDREGYAINASCSSTPVNQQANLRLTSASMLTAKACILKSLSWVILMPVNQACPDFSEPQTEVL